MTYFNDVKRRSEAGIAKDCMATYSLSQGGNQGMTDVEVAYALSAPFTAGVDTVRRSLNDCFDASDSVNGVHRCCQQSIGLSVRIYRIMNTFPSKIPAVVAICFPESLKKLQAELDSVVGRDRMPTFDDERSLPYLVAFVKEVTRCVLLSCLSLPGVDTSDHTYKMAPCSSDWRTTCNNQSRCV
jgi:Cytochrome P450